MISSNDKGVRLLSLAAESVVAVVPGCAAALHLDLGATRPAPALRGDSQATKPSPMELHGQPDAITRFGQLIVASWSAWLATLSKEEQQQAIEELAAIGPRAAQQIIGAVLDRLLSKQGDPLDRKIAVDYLTAIPTTTGAVLVPDPDTGRMIATRSPVEETVLLRFLPVNPPPFAPASDLPGTPYILEELLGSGGFGVVYRAQNRFEQHGPPRAIKFCLNRAMITTLQRERALLDRLMSAGAEAQWSDRIVKLYGHTLDAPIPFLIYEYIPGGNLINRLAAIRRQSGQNLRPSQVLGLVRRICEAVAFAHDRGLVHRDIKPSNILVSGNTIKLADFGIGGVVATYAARTSQIGKNQPGNLSLSEKCSLFRGAGTPLYMSPEQRQGDAPDPRHDVYSIGVIWYQLLIGDYTRELHPGWADELADEFDIPQKQIDLIQQCVGYVKKRPASARTLLAMIPAPNVLQVTVPKAEKPGEVRVLEGHQARVNSLAFLRDSKRLLSGAADGTVRLWDVEATREVTCFRPNARSALSVAVSPDDRRAVFGCDDRNAWLWDLGREIMLQALSGHTLDVTSAAFSPDARRIVTGSGDGSIRLWHVASGREILRVEEGDSPITGVVFTVDGLFFLSCAQDGAFRMWDVETGWEAHELSSGSGWLLCLAVSPDGKRAACGGKDKLTLWSLESRQMLGTFQGHALPVTSVAFSPDGQWLVSGSMDKTVRLWDVASQQQLHVFEGHAQPINSVACSPNSRLVASGGFDRAVRLWVLPSADQVKR